MDPSAPAGRDSAELSALASGLDELTRRVTAVADRRHGQTDDTVSGDLYEVERLLLAAGRRLATVVRRAAREGSRGH